MAERQFDERSRGEALEDRGQSVMPSSPAEIGSVAAELVIAFAATGSRASAGARHRLVARLSEYAGRGLTGFRAG
jgi:hypothetical protein